MRKILWGFVIFIVLAILGIAFYLNSLMPIITGYSAKYMASAVFVSNRNAEEVKLRDLNFSFIKYVSYDIDLEQKSVKSSFLWSSSKAIYRDGFGCTLLRDISENDLRKIKYPIIAPLSYSQDTTPWPLGNVLPNNVPAGINQKEANRVVSDLLSDSIYGGNAYAAVVLYNGVPVAEQYDLEFDSSTLFLSWSMAKSFTGSLAGILVKDNRFEIDKPTGLKDWQNDERKNITLRNLLQMSSGLHWNEDYGNRSDVTVMLYCKSDFARFAYCQSLDFPVGSHWYYSSGCTNIVEFLIRDNFENDQQYYAYCQQRLFNKIGMPNAIFEVDDSGTRVGSSYIYATARDYARYALLYLQDGVFNNEQILPKDWVAESVRPAENSNGKYGFFLWLNQDGNIAALPKDSYSCKGHDGQRIFIVPSKNLAVVILGYSPNNLLDFNAFFEDFMRNSF